MNHKNMNPKLKLKGMTLTELLVVLAILGILILMAFPMLKPLISGTYATEAKTNLKHLSQLQEIYHMKTGKYSSEFSEISFEQNKLETEGGTAVYKIEIVDASKSNFKAKAIAVRDFDDDGVMNEWEIDKDGIPRELVPD